jgi:hypothetical protein
VINKLYGIAKTAVFFSIKEEASISFFLIQRNRKNNGAVISQTVECHNCSTFCSIKEIGYVSSFSYTQKQEIKKMVHSFHKL